MFLKFIILKNITIRKPILLKKKCLVSVEKTFYSNKLHSWEYGFYSYNENAQSLQKITGNLRVFRRYKKNPYRVFIFYYKFNDCSYYG